MIKVKQSLDEREDKIPEKGDSALGGAEIKGVSLRLSASQTCVELASEGEVFSV